MCIFVNDILNELEFSGGITAQEKDELKVGFEQLVEDIAGDMLNAIEIIDDELTRCLAMMESEL